MRTGRWDEGIVYEVFMTYETYILYSPTFAVDGRSSTHLDDLTTDTNGFVESSDNIGMPVGFVLPPVPNVLDLVSLANGKTNQLPVAPVAAITRTAKP